MDAQRRQEIREELVVEGCGCLRCKAVHELFAALDAAEQERDRRDQMLRLDLWALVDDLAGDDTRATYLRAVVTRYWPGGSHA